MKLSIPLKLISLPKMPESVLLISESHLYLISLKNHLKIKNLGYFGFSHGTPGLVTVAHGSTLGSMTLKGHLIQQIILLAVEDGSMSAVFISNHMVVHLQSLSNVGAITGMTLVYQDGFRERYRLEGETHQLVEFTVKPLELKILSALETVSPVMDYQVLDQSLICSSRMKQGGKLTVISRGMDTQLDPIAEGFSG
jgi:hypothetical protein